MPLQNKCKTYKEEDVCRAKICAWLCLIENINENLPSHFLAVVLPFLNYCFGINEQISGNIQKNKQNHRNSLMYISYRGINHIQNFDVKYSDEYTIDILTPIEIWVICHYIEIVNISKQYLIVIYRHRERHLVLYEASLLITRITLFDQ